MLRITDGTTYVNLTAVKKRSGFSLVSWRPSVATYKAGGIFRDSPFSDGRELVDAQWQHPIETIVVNLRDNNVDANVERLQNLRRLLEKANNYWKTKWQDEPVWIEARSNCETNIRYGLIYNARVEGDADPYAQPLITQRRPIQPSLSILVERGHWLSYRPGTGTCAELSGVKDWHYDDIWASSSNQPTGIVCAIETGRCGYIFAGDQGKIWRTTDPVTANNWASTALAHANCLIYDIMESNSGHLYAAGYDSGGVTGYSYSSVDCGVTWATFGGGVNRGSDAFHGLYQGGDGKIYLATGATLGAPRPLLSTTVGGTTWSIVTSNATWSRVDSITEVGTRMLLGIQNSDSDGEIWYTDDYWVTSNRGYVFDGAYPTVLFTTSDGIVLAGTNTGELWSSTDGIAWALRKSGLGGQVYGVDEDVESKTIYCTADSVVWISLDGGYTWNWSEDVQGALVYAVHYSSTIPSTGMWYVGNSGDIYLKNNVESLGRSATCLDEVFVVNKRAERNITDIWVYDDNLASYTAGFPSSAFSLLPAVPTADDAVYFGIDASLQVNGSPPIDNIVVDIGVPSFGITGTWQYYNGTWDTLTVQDGTDAGSGAFSRSGVSSVHWEVPDDWTTVAVSTVTALWVRYLVTAVGGTIVTPTQQNRSVYSCIQPVVDVDSAQVAGTLQAIAHHALRIRSDKDGPGGSAPNLYANRVIVGLRSTSRGEDFTSYLNCADEQNPISIQCSLGSNTTFVDYLDAAPGRAAFYQPSGLQSMAMRVRFELANTLSEQYHGSYRAFLRCKQLYGATGDVRVRLYIGTPWGSDDYWSQIKSIPNTFTYNKLIDFGEIKLPLSQLVADERTSSTKIEVHAECTTSGSASATATLGAWMSSRLIAPYDTAPQGGVNPTDMDHWLSQQLWYDGSTLLTDFPSLYFLDLILIPSDEWLGDFVDNALSLSTALSNGRTFEIDSIYYPKTELRGLVRASATDTINAIYIPLAPGPATLQPNANQRLWFLFDKSNELYSPDWDSSQHICASVQSFSNSRYLGMRGSR